MDPQIIILTLLILLGLVGVGSRFVPGSTSDNIIEETIEEVIEMKTGCKVDLSPGTPDEDIKCNDMKHDNV